jgi:hypothetical protein
MISAHLITEATAGSRPITLRHARQGLGNVEQALEQAHPEDDQPHLHHAAGPHGPKQRTRQPNTTACRRRRSGRLAANRRWNGRAAPPQKRASREQTAEVGPGGHSEDPAVELEESYECCADRRYFGGS